MTGYKVMRRDHYDSDANGIIDFSESVSILATAGSGGVNAYQVVMMNEVGAVIPADGENSTHAGLVIGLSSENIAEGDEGVIIASGEIQNLDWNLEPGQIYYIGLAGTIVLTPSSHGFWQKVGVAKDSVTLIIELGEPILLV